MLIDLIQGGSITNVIIGFCVSLFVVFCIIPLHECAHALIAYKLGDDTAKQRGRLTLYPFAHINPIGALMIFIVGFGYAEPVPVNINRVKTKNKKLAMAIIALAGPVSNLLAAVISVLLMFVTTIFSGNETISNVFYIFFNYAAIININLAVFNFIPIPPLDGSRILFAILPSKYYFKVMKYERYIVWAVFFLLITGILTKPLSAISHFIFNGMFNFFYVIFRSIF